MTHERFWQAHLTREFYEPKERELGLYPEWDLPTDVFEVLWEFDPETPNRPIADPAYRLRAG